MYSAPVGGEVCIKIFHNEHAYENLWGMKFTTYVHTYFTEQLLSGNKLAAAQRSCEV